MWRSRFHCVVVLGLLLSWAGAAAQTPEKLAQLYRQHQIEQLISFQKKKLIGHPDWNRFVTLLQLSNADSALKEFISLYQQADDNQLKRFIRSRIAQYYSIQGLYKTAQRIEQDDLFWQNYLQKYGHKVRYGIQVGAFSTLDNALRRKKELEQKGLSVSVQNKNNNGATLYSVIAGNYPSRAAAEKALQRMKRKYQIDGFVIQY